MAIIRAAAKKIEQSKPVERDTSKARDAAAQKAGKKSAIDKKDK